MSDIVIHGRKSGSRDVLRYIDMINGDIKDAESNARILYSNMCNGIWGHIRMLNKKSKTSYLYCAPYYLIGQELYVLEDYVAYVTEHFRKQGIDVRYVFPNKILFSWMDNRGTLKKIDNMEKLFAEDMKSKLILATSGKKTYEKQFKHLLEAPKESEEKVLLITDGRTLKLPKGAKRPSPKLITAVPRGYGDID